MYSRHDMKQMHSCYGSGLGLYGLSRAQKGGPRTVHAATVCVDSTPVGDQGLARAPSL